MRTDKPTKAILIGMVAGPVFEPFTLIMKHFGLTDLTATEAISLMWLKEPSWILGILGAIGIAAWVSLIMYCSIRLWGIDYFPLKTLLIAMTSESLVFNIFGILGKNERLIQGVSGNFVHATAAALAGLIVGFFMKWFLFGKDH